MPDAKPVYDWNVRLKGHQHLILVTDATGPVRDMDGGLIYFHDEAKNAKAVFPVDAISSVVRSTGHELAVYPVDVTDTGHIRNVKADGTGHWVPYTGPLFGIKE